MGRAKAARALSSHSGRRETRSRVRARRHLNARVWLFAFVFVAVGVAAYAIRYEGDSSRLQAALLTRVVDRLSFEIAPGPAPRRAMAPSGPFDIRRGYSQLPDFEARLAASGMRVVEQAGASTWLEQATRWGITPPFPERINASLRIHSDDDTLLYRGSRDEKMFSSFDAIPPLLVDTLLFIENKELLRPKHPTQNPTVEWKRLGKAALSYFGGLLGLSDRLEGGSTLATQLEKFRHSPRGRTASGTDKLRQIASASLSAYRGGPDTRARRREIVAEYLNSIPLAAARGYGEVYGFGAGMRAWFGMTLDQVTYALNLPGGPPEKIRAYKHSLALIVALRAPYRYLIADREGLNRRIRRFLRLLTLHGVIDEEFASAVEQQPLEFRAVSPPRAAPSFRDRKAVNAVRTHLQQLLGVRNLYDLDRLDLEVASTFDRDLQRASSRLLTDLGQREFVRAHGLNGERLLGGGDPSQVLYSILLFERAPEGNLLRVQIDNLDKPLDLNRGIKLELGSTAKLRTLAHYLEVIALTYGELAHLKRHELREREAAARDPLTAWTAGAMAADPGRTLAELLEKALDRRYSATPGSFFTGGGMHTFGNFDRRDAGTIPLLDGFRRSVNLVFIRVMRDLVSYHRARLPYDAQAVLEQPDSPVRKKLLDEIADAEAYAALKRAYARFEGLTPIEIPRKLLGSRADSARHLAVLFWAWRVGSTEEQLERWLRQHRESLAGVNVGRLLKAYDNPRLTISDYGFLIDRHPLEVWAAGEMWRRPGVSRDELFQGSGEARRTASEWLYKTRNRSAQTRRLRIRVEQDAFARMTPYWQRLGFPFGRLVPSYATAIGSSGDRPAALADLMGIIVNDGRRRPATMIEELRFAKGTPYESVFTIDNPGGDQVIAPEVARALEKALAEVVERGTARAIDGTFVLADGSPAVVGGKTGTGDNRFRTFSHAGERSSRVVNRTATFVFFIDDRYYGVLTAFVPGSAAAGFSYTSSLAVNVLRLLAPAINQELAIADESVVAKAE